MEKKAFQAESKRLMDLMINSIYTHKEIFLREIISNASDAMDKLAYRALTDDQVGLSKDDFKLVVTADKEARQITVSDNGIGMDKDAMEQNLGTIAKSGSYQFKQDMEEKDDSELDIIGQFGVGFYSAFMVAEKVVVVSKAYGADTAYRWESEGIDGYTIEPCEKDSVGTDVIMTIKEDANEEDYTQYLTANVLSDLVKKYSDYIRYPIRMELDETKMKEKPADAGDDYKPEYETVKEWKTVNSMVPLWQRAKSQVSQEEYNSFYREKFMDFKEPLVASHIQAEGTLEYKALLYIPSQAPMDYYTGDYKRGLQLYSSGVMIMESCEQLLPDYLAFVRGVVDSPDVSLNISREMLQNDRQLTMIANNLEKKINNELKKLIKNEREQYEVFWQAFGKHLKFSLMNSHGANKDQILDLLLFWSSKDNALTGVKEYVERMPESQEYIYYVIADSVEKAQSLPQAERVLNADYEVFYLTAEEDEFVIQMLHEIDGKAFISVADEKALPMTQSEKDEAEQAEKDYKDLLDFVKETIGDAITSVRISKILKSGAVCLTADGPISIEMEQYFKKIGSAFPMQTGHVLELNSNAPVFEAMKKSFETDKEKAGKYAEILYNQALIISDLPLPDPVRYTQLVCDLMAE